MENQNQRRTR